MDACTIVARNYLPYARVFARALTAIHPGAHVTVLVIDGAADSADQALFDSLGLEELLPDAAERRRLALIYDATELSTAVKPLLLRHLLAAGASSVLYFDPDVQVFESVAGLWQMAAEHGIVLTPHVLAPIPDDGFEVSELAVLRAGVFNLGFIGVGPGAAPFLDWWWGRLRRHCISDVASGLFVDQRWVDYVPGLFPHAIIKDPGCNVAYWNLHERQVVRTASGLLVNGLPLRFYHFSGFDPQVPYLLSQYQESNPRVLLSEQLAVRELCEKYAADLRAAGYCPVPERYAFAALPDGTPIDTVMRRAFRRALIDAERLGTELPPWPFAWDDILQWFNAPAPEAPRLSRYLFALYGRRPDLQHAFPRPHGEHASAYVHWARFDPRANETIPAALRPNGHAAAPAPTREVRPADGLNICGYFKAALGVGEVARLLASAAQAGGTPVATVLNDRTLSHQDDGFEVGVNGGPYAVTLVCANADQFPSAVDAMPRSMIENCHRIGFWFWETEQLPRAQGSSSDLLDEIWVASSYVADAIRTTVSKPVHVCPLPLRAADPAPMSRADLGLPDGFVFLFMYDLLSSLHRKNPIGLVEAFCRAFAPGEGPTLVLKSINGHLARAALEAVRAAAAGRPDIMLIDACLPARQRDALMIGCDCYVSLHRSEGFGLTLADAMALGKPTIATGYSGNMAFMTPENSFLVPWRAGRVPAGCDPYPQGDAWAEPDAGAAASLMRLAYENRLLARDRGARARRDVMDRLSPARTAAFIRERLAVIAAGREGVVSDAATPHLHERPLPAAALAAPAPPVTLAREPVLCASLVPWLDEQLELAHRDAREADHLLAAGIPFRTASRFGWPGQLLRTAMLRVLRPYAHFEARAHRQHLQSTIRLLETVRVLRGGDGGAAQDRRIDGQHASDADE